MKTNKLFWSRVANPLFVALTGIAFIGATGCGVAPSNEVVIAQPAVQTVAFTEEIVDAACGECQLGMEGVSCDLAVRTKSGDYFVDGTSLDAHGEAHDDHGMCNCIRKAKVTGKIENGRFVAQSFELLPREENLSDK